MARVHVGLNLKDEAAEGFLDGLHEARRRLTRTRRRRPGDESVEHVLYAEIVDAGAEEDGALFAGEELSQIKGFGRPLNELDRFAHVRHFHREETVELGIVEPFDHLLILR